MSRLLNIGRHVFPS